VCLTQGYATTRVNGFIEASVCVCNARICRVDTSQILNNYKQLSMHRDNNSNTTHLSTTHLLMTLCKFTVY